MFDYDKLAPLPMQVVPRDYLYAVLARGVATVVEDVAVAMDKDDAHFHVLARRFFDVLRRRDWGFTRSPVGRWLPCYHTNHTRIPAQFHVATPDLSRAIQAMLDADEYLTAQDAKDLHAARPD